MIEPVARIRIELQEVEGSIWRRVDVPTSTSLAGLHDIIQIVMPWQDCHLHEFVINGRAYGDPVIIDQHELRRLYKAKSLRLDTLVSRGVRGFPYLYDYGDYWEHDIVIEDVFDGRADVAYPDYVAGSGRCPPEDVGGTTGFAEFLKAVRDTRHKEHEEWIYWYGGPFDPEKIDEEQIRARLSVKAARRRGPLARRNRGRTRHPSASGGRWAHTKWTRVH